MAKDMVTINVLKKFRLTNQDLTQQDFNPGTHEVHKDVAENWFVKQHTDMSQSVPTSVGSADHVARAKQIRDGAKAALDKAEDNLRVAEQAMNAEDSPAITEVTPNMGDTFNPMPSGYGVSGNGAPYAMPVVNEQATGRPPGTEPRIADPLLKNSPGEVKEAAPKKAKKSVDEAPTSSQSDEDFDLESAKAEAEGKAPPLRRR